MFESTSKVLQPLSIIYDTLIYRFQFTTPQFTTPQFTSLSTIKPSFIMQETTFIHYKLLTTNGLTSAPDECISKTDWGGLKYRGNVSVTVSGHVCQRWDSQSPNEQKYAKWPAS